MKIAGSIAAQALDEVTSFVQPGISTNKLHPRGPIGLNQLTTYKYILEGKGQVRK